AVPDEVSRGRAVAVDRLRLGEYVDHDPAGCGIGGVCVGCRAVVGAAGAGQRILPVPQRADRIGPPLLFGPGVVPAHRGRDFIEPTVEGNRIGTPDAAGDVGHPVGRHLDLDVPVDVTLAGQPHRLGIDVDHQPVDVIGQ